MFLATFTIENESFSYIYYKTKEGYKEYLKDTFSPCIEELHILDLSIKGQTYEERKANAEDLAITYQTFFACLPWSYGEHATICEYFEKIGKRYGLLKVFKENCIC